MHFVIRPAKGWTGSHDDVRQQALQWITITFGADALECRGLLITNRKRFKFWYASLNAVAKQDAGQYWISVLNKVEDKVRSLVIIGSIAAIDETLAFASHGEFDIYIDDENVIHLPVIVYMPRKPKSTTPS